MFVPILFLLIFYIYHFTMFGLFEDVTELLADK